MPLMGWIRLKAVYLQRRYTRRDVYRYDNTVLFTH